MIQIDEGWLATILCALNDAIKYNDGLRHSETIRDVEDIEEWLMQLFHCKDYLQDAIAKYPELEKKLSRYIEQ